MTLTEYAAWLNKSDLSLAWGFEAVNQCALRRTVCCFLDSNVRLSVIVSSIKRFVRLPIVHEGVIKESGHLRETGNLVAPWIKVNIANVLNSLPLMSRRPTHLWVGAPDRENGNVPNSPSR